MITLTFVHHVISFMKHLANAGPKFRERFIKHNTQYFDAVITEADDRIKDNVMTLEQFIVERRENGGVRPFFDLIEYALKLDLPDEVFEDEALMRIENAGIDGVVWANVSTQVFFAEKLY